MTVQEMWNWEPAIYLFLGGLAGGTFFVSALVRLISKDAFRRLAVAAPWISFGALSVGLLCLVVEVEKPLQAMMLWRSFVNFSSWMTIGAWLLLVALAVFFACAVASTPRLVKILKLKEKIARGIVKATLIVGSVLGLGVAAYTGVLLMAARAIPFWDTPLIPVLFTVSALDAGCAVVLGCLLRDKHETASRMRHTMGLALMALIVAEALVLAMLLAGHTTGGTSEAVAAATLITGDLSLQFWAIVVVCGLIAPFAIDCLMMVGAFKKKEARLIGRTASIVLVLIGGLALRYVILKAGIHAVSVSPDYAQAIQGVFNIVL